jgi:CDP-paratose 2-epimerase
MKKILVTGSNGLIGSEVCLYFGTHGWEIHGIDNNQRAVFFGPQGDTRWNQRRIAQSVARFCHHEVDIRERQVIGQIIRDVRPDLLVHAAAQPSHDLAAKIPFDDFETNAVGTLNLLEAARHSCKDAPFILMSTNKVYGDAPNSIPLVELDKRWEYRDDEARHGISETFQIDHSKHSLFGASKLAADIMVQEYGRYFDMPTCCLRGGCLTGPNHSGVELHGFLSYLVKCNLEGREYKIYGYKGKQVRDNIHSADVVAFMNEFYRAPRCAEVYNLGGGRANSVSILEAFELAEGITGRRQRYTYVDQNRSGDHICYYSDLRKMQSHYPAWRVTRTVSDVIGEISGSWKTRLAGLGAGANRGRATTSS